MNQCFGGHEMIYCCLEIVQIGRKDFLWSEITDAHDQFQRMCNKYQNIVSRSKFELQSMKFRDRYENVNCAIVSKLRTIAIMQIRWCFMSLMLNVEYSFNNESSPVTDHLISLHNYHRSRRFEDNFSGSPLSCRF